VGAVAVFGTGSTIPELTSGLRAVIETSSTADSER
jgi:hypothetical protein